MFRNVNYIYQNNCLNSKSSKQNQPYKYHTHHTLQSLISHISHLSFLLFILTLFSIHHHIHILTPFQTRKHYIVLIYICGTVMMKREREVDSVTMANYLMLLSAGGEFESTNYLNYSSNHRVFECKTCKRQFPSFQALGGHRASHKKPRLMVGESEHNQVLHGSPPKPKTHECSVCGLEFAIGQALGGHMRRHRTSSNGNTNNATATTVHNTSSPKMNHKGSSNERVLFPDLNLTPLENDLEFLKIRQPAPLVHCFN